MMIGEDDGYLKKKKKKVIGENNGDFAEIMRYFNWAY